MTASDRVRSRERIRDEHPQQLDNSTMRILFKHGRHLHASVWVIQQYIIDLKPYARSTTSAVFLFHCPNCGVAHERYSDDRVDKFTVLNSRDRRLLFENYTQR